MRNDFLILSLLALVSLMVFAWMKSKQAVRNDERRQRIQQKQDELMESLQKERLDKDKNSNHES